MNLFTKLLISLGTAIALSATLSGYQENGAAILPLNLDTTITVAFGICAIISTLIGNMRSAHHEESGYSGADGPDREHGEVKWFNVNKGFGFITSDDGDDIFVHFRSIRGEGRRSLKDGQRVEYDIVDSDKGPQAEDVCPV